MKALSARKLGVAAICGALCLCLSSCAQSPVYKYGVSEYKATIDLSNTSSDAKVTLDITYNIGDQYKSDGFKFVANNEAEDLACYSDSGEKLKAEIQHLRETKLVWYFPAVKNTIKTVRVSFTLKDQLKKTGDNNSLLATWIGIFRIPVKRAVYEVILPSNIEPKELIVKPSAFNSYYESGRCHIVVSQSPLKQKELYIEYKE
jgi:hypothetical protein